MTMGMDATATTSVLTGLGVESRVTVTENPDTVWDEIDMELGGSTTSASRYITPKSALAFGPVWQAVTVLADDVAQLPLVAYQRVEQGKERATAHPGHFLLHRQPNPELGPFDFKHLMTARMLLWGNAYAWIERVAGVPVALWPIEPGDLTPLRANGELLYTSPKTGETLRPDEVFHLRGPGPDDLCAPSVITKARATIEGGINAEEHGTAFYRNQARPDLVLEFPNAVKPDAAKNILRHWSSRHGGPMNAGKPGFLDQGGKVTTYSVSHADAQWLEGRKYSRTEVAGWFKLPPYKLNDLERATFSNIEHQGIDYLRSSLMPWLIRWHDEANRKLLTTREFRADSHFFEFVTNALLRGDAKARAEFYNLGVQGGWMTRNEVRSLENLNTLDGLDQPLTPLNMSEGPQDDPEEGARHQLLHNLATMLSKSAAAAAKRAKGFTDWASEGARKAHYAHAVTQLEACGVENVEKRAEWLFNHLRDQYLKAADGSPDGFAQRVAETGRLLVAEAPKTLLGPNP